METYSVFAQATFNVSEIALQQYDEYGKIFTLKIQFVYYREKLGLRADKIPEKMQR